MKRLCVFGLTLLLAGLFLVVGKADSKRTEGVTFNRDVAPIVFQNCAGCHRPGQVAPMSLLSYKEVRPWAKSIREKVVRREMPPWLADPRHGEFLNDCRLSQKDIDTIVAWADGGAKEGDPRDLPQAPKFRDGWTIGQPDVVFSMTQDYSVPPEGEVPYKYFAVPTNFTEDKYVQLGEIRRGEPSVVHHVIVSVREPGQGALPPAGEIRTGIQSVNPEDAQDPQRVQQETQRGNNPDGALIVWAPGMSPLLLKPGRAKLVKKGSVLIFQMHYTTNGVAAKDRTSVGLIFAKGPVEKRVITKPVLTDVRKLIIPAGDPSFESHSSFTFPEDIHIVSFMPHMHVRGKDFEYRLVYPDGTSKILLKVPRYDFNWQLVYFLKEPVSAPKGSRLECLAHHDNSTRNRYNPDPTKEVRWGDQTWEEMMIGWLDYTLDGQDLRQTTAQLK
jgi:hypothetical protein